MKDIKIRENIPDPCPQKLTVQYEVGHQQLRLASPTIPGEGEKPEALG